jgi:hypothetical protein
VAGAISPGEVEGILSALGFQAITIRQKEQSEEIVRGWNVAHNAEKIVFSAYIQAVKPVTREMKRQAPDRPTMKRRIWNAIRQKRLL